MDPEQEKFLEDAKRVIKEQAFFMKKSLDAGKLRDALRSSSTMLSELKTSQLSPRTYYILFMQIFDELRVLENYFKDEWRKGRKINELYESVQHAQNIIPRLYLLITVGSVYIQTGEVKAKEILFDLLEMIKGVQNPLRGLFLRYYFLKMCKDKLPDVDNEYAGEGGTVEDSINVILYNLSEMNKLWIRMQGNKDQQRREKERIDLKVTVGENLHRLSGLEGVNAQMYKENVLPKLLDLIVHSNDTISQQYLVDCLIQAFPDEYHLGNLKLLLDTFTTNLSPNVDIKTIFINLMDRLADFALNSQEIGELSQEVNIYQMFKTHIDKIINENTNIELTRLLDLQVAFLKFTLRCYPQNSTYVNEILKSCCVICEKNTNFDESCLKNIVFFLTMPLETMSLTILQMNEYLNLMKYLPFVKRRQVANKICQAVVHLQNNISSREISKQLLQFINPLLVTEKDFQNVEPYEFQEEQQVVAKLIHLIQTEDCASTLEILNDFKDKFLQGGADRMKFTLPSLIFTYMKLIRTSIESSQEIDKHQLVTTIKELIDMIQQQVPETALKLYLELALCINDFDEKQELDEFTYDVITASMMIYEDNLGDSDSKSRALNLFIATLQRIHCIEQENYDTLITNATQYGAKLLKKNEQCTSVLKCTHLFFNEHYKNEQRVFECFKKCLKLAGICLKQSIMNLNLYILILNKFFFFLNKEVTNLKISDIQECLILIKSKIPELSQAEDKQKAKEIYQYWERTIEYIQERKNQGDQNFEQLEI